MKTKYKTSCFYPEYYRQLNNDGIRTDTSFLTTARLRDSLLFRYEIIGMAEIMTKPRRLLIRLFDNLKYIASKK